MAKIKGGLILFVGTGLVLTLLAGGFTCPVYLTAMEYLGLTVVIVIVLDLLTRVLSWVLSPLLSLIVDIIVGILQATCGIGFIFILVGFFRELHQCK